MGRAGGGRVKWLFLTVGLAAAIRGGWCFGQFDFSAGAKVALAGGGIALLLAGWCWLVDGDIAQRKQARREQESERLRGVAGGAEDAT